MILLHDTLNESVRAGLESLGYEEFEKVRLVDLDFVPGRVMREGPREDEYWSGLGLIVTGDCSPLHGLARTRCPMSSRPSPVAALLRVRLGSSRTSPTGGAPGGSEEARGARADDGELISSASLHRSEAQSSHAALRADG